jgi:hypothetical protein
MNLWSENLGMPSEDVAQGHPFKPRVPVAEWDFGALKMRFDRGRGRLFMSNVLQCAECAAPPPQFLIRSLVAGWR